MKVQNRILALDKQDIADISRSVANLLESEQNNNMELHFPVTVNYDSVDPLNQKNLNFSHECASDSNDLRFDIWHQQRLSNGFDETELWHLYVSIAKFVLPRLIAFKSTTKGTPCSFASDVTWKEAIDKMIFAFKFIVDDKNLQEMDDNGNMVLTEDGKKCKEGLQLFTDNFFNLWW